MGYLEDLEEECTKRARGLQIPDETWARFMATIAPLKMHNVAMYNHSLRVGLYSYGIADAEETVLHRLALYSGCAHDVGKCKISNDLLNCTTELKPEDWVELHKHPLFSYEMLKNEFPMTALVAGMHHLFTPKHYGIDLSKCIEEWMKERHLHNVLTTTYIVTISDFFDAVTTRRNASSLVADPRNMDEVHAVMCGFFPETRSRVDWLCEHLLEYHG